MQRLDLFKLPEGFRGRGAVACQLWWLVQDWLFALSPQFMYGWRNFLLRAFGARIGKNVLIRPSVKVTYPWKLKIDDYVWVGDDVRLYSLAEITIKRHSVISQQCYLCAAGHDYTDKTFPIYGKPIVIQEGVWLATDVFVAPGVTIGDNSVVGARSSVFSSLAADYVYMGCPARPVKPRATDPER